MPRAYGRLLFLQDGNSEVSSQLQPDETAAPRNPPRVPQSNPHHRTNRPRHAKPNPPPLSQTHPRSPRYPRRRATHLTRSKTAFCELRHSDPRPQKPTHKYVSSRTKSRAFSCPPHFGGRGAQRGSCFFAAQPSLSVDRSMALGIASEFEVLPAATY